MKNLGRDQREGRDGWCIRKRRRWINHGSSKKNDEENEEELHGRSVPDVPTPGNDTWHGANKIGGGGGNVLATVLEAGDKSRICWLTLARALRVKSSV